MRTFSDLLETASYIIDHPLNPDHRGKLETSWRYPSWKLVGITDPDLSLTAAESADPHRHEPQANPLTYFEWRSRPG